MSIEPIYSAGWIQPAGEFKEHCPAFQRKFVVSRPVREAVLYITALGMYQAHINGSPVTDTCLNPGWTAYRKRLQVQRYDVGRLLRPENTLTVTVGECWFKWLTAEDGRHVPRAVLAALEIRYADGEAETICTDSQWTVYRSPVVYSDIYNGETQDLRLLPEPLYPVERLEYPLDALIQQEGEPVRETELLSPVGLFTAPNGERYLDFGQNIAGYVRVSVSGKAGDRVVLTHAEVLDREGNVYTGNLRGARQRMDYTLSGRGREILKPRFTFQGFRYVRVDAFPGPVDPACFTAAAVHTDLRRTGRFSSSHPLLNRFFENVVWTQRDNFIDIPLDCPQRDERFGWTGDAQLFSRTACYNFDCRRFFRKWLRDLAADQFPDGSVPHVIPFVFDPSGSWLGGAAGYGDSAVIVPWNLYCIYGDRQVLAEQLDSMKSWLKFLDGRARDRGFIWDNSPQFGDWLGLDAPSGSYKGSTDEALIATAYYAYSSSLLAKIAAVLGDSALQEECLNRFQAVAGAYRRRFMPEGRLLCRTQTAHVLTLAFGLAEEPGPLVETLVSLIGENGGHLTTGIMGTPYLLYVLSAYGHTGLAYTLLLQEDFPSWLYAVRQGATTVWEHWDNIKADGSFWSDDMNSFNHVMFGSVTAWLYEVAAGIRPDEEQPGFRHSFIEPHPDPRLERLAISLDTAFGTLSSGWSYTKEGLRFEVTVPKGTAADFCYGTVRRRLDEGTHVILMDETNGMDGGDRK